MADRILNWQFPISIGGQSTKANHRLTYNTLEDVDLDADAAGDRMAALLIAARGAFLHSTYVMGVRVRYAYEVDGTPIGRDEEARKLDDPVRGTRRAPVGDADEPVSLPAYIAVECVRNPVRGRGGVFKLRGALSFDDVEMGDNGQFRFKTGGTASAEINAALNAIGVAFDAPLVIPPRGNRAAKIIKSQSVRGIVDNDPTRTRKSLETLEKQLAVREAEKLAKALHGAYEALGSPANFIAGVPEAIQEVVTQLRALIAKHGPAIFKDILEALPAILRALLS